MPLPDDVLSQFADFRAARDAACQALDALARLPTHEIAIAGSPLRLRTVDHGRTKVQLRPINSDLFIADRTRYERVFEEFLGLLGALAAAGGAIDGADKQAARRDKLISRALYTTLQASGAAMDYLCSPNQARKNFGMRFEDLATLMFAALGIGQKPVSFGLPYTFDGVPQVFNNQVDLVISPRSTVRSHRTRLDPDEVVTSIKTSSKDRFAKIFFDKELLRVVLGREVSVIALFHNDVQRAGLDKVATTFVAGNFIAYVRAFGPLTGVYYVDPPPHIARDPWRRYLRTFEDLLLEDIWSVVF